uniref:SHSP domain-containing protein n=1 Tax=Oncorhynchus mykiss TaxID=8022 RepID=A0A8K9WYF0_ONCMY
MARGPTSSQPAGSTTEKPARDQEQSGAYGKISSSRSLKSWTMSRPSLTIQPVSYKHDKDGEGFALTLDTKDFSPEELSVKQVGRKLKVSGKTEKKLDDGEGSYSYRCQEFRQEFDLPEEVNPETVTCSLAHDGKLHIQAPKNPLSCEDEVAERVVPINCRLWTPSSLLLNYLI